MSNKPTNLLSIAEQKMLKNLIAADLPGQLDRPPDPPREALEGLLSRSVSDGDVFKDQARLVLPRVLKPTSRRVGDDVVTKAVSEGLAPLTLGELKQLALDMVSLEKVYHGVLTESPEAWVEALMNAGRSQMEREGVPIPPAETFLLKIPFDAADRTSEPLPLLPYKQKPERGAGRRWLLYGGLALAAAACLAVIFRPMGTSMPVAKPALAIQTWDVHRQRVLGTPKLEGDVVTNRPAFVRLVMIDERFERWTIHSGGKGEFVVWIDKPWTFTFDDRPNAADPSSPRGIIMGIITSETPAPTEQQILDAIPDPVAPPGTSRVELESRLVTITETLGQRFGCTVRWAPIPHPAD